MCAAVGCSILSFQKTAEAIACNCTDSPPRISVAALLQLAWTRLPKPLAFVAGVKSYLLVPEIELSLVILVCICAVVTPLAAYLLFSDQ